MTETERTVMRHLLEGWIGASHNADTYLQIAEKVQGFPALRDQWLADPTRIQMTNERMKPLRDLVEAVMEDRQDDLLALLNSAGLDLKPN